MKQTTLMATGSPPRRISLLAAAAVGLLATFIVLFLPEPTVSARQSKTATSGQVLTDRESRVSDFSAAEHDPKPTVFEGSSIRSRAVDPNDHSDGIDAMMADELPTVTIEAITDSVFESMGPMRFRLNAEPAAGADIYVTLEAEEPEDAGWLPPAYEEEFSVKIPAGESTFEFEIPVRNLFNLEGNGSVEVSLVADEDEYHVGDPVSVSVSVTDDEEPITVTYSDAGDIRVSEDDGTVAVDLMISVEGNVRPGTYETEDVTAEGIPFVIESVPGSAYPPGDFGNSFHAVHLPIGSFVKQSSGEYVAHISVAWEIVDDVLDEGGDEFFYVTTPSFNIPWLTLPLGPKRIVIEDNDVAQIRLMSDALEIDEGDSAQVWARLEGDVVLAQPETLSVEFAGVAQKDQDYEADSEVLNIAAGSPISTDVVNIRTLRDDVSEATETVEVKMMSEGDVVVDKIELSIMDRTVPELTSAVVDGSNLTLNLSEDLDETSEPSASAFDVTVDAVDRTVTNVSVSGSTATLTIDPAAEAGQTVMIDYTVSGSMQLQSADGVAVQSIADYAVTNDTANNPPSFLTSGASIELLEDKPVGTDVVALGASDDDESQILVFTLEGDDTDTFELVVDGSSVLIRLKRPFDRSVKQVHNLVVSVNDGNGGTATTEVVITVIGGDELGKVVIVPDRPLEGLPVSAYVNDADGVVGEVEWQWSIADTANGPSTSIQGATSNTYAPTANDVGKYLKVTARYDDGHGTSKIAEGVLAQNVGANLPDDATTDGQVIVDGGPVSGYIDPGYVTFASNGAGECEFGHRVFDHDWWGVEVVEGRNYLIEMRGADTGDGTLVETRFWGMANTHGESKTDRSYGDVYDAYGDIGSGQGRNSRMVFTAVETGLVYIDVSSNNAMDVNPGACPIRWWYPGRQTGSYELEVTSVAGVLDGQGGATPVALGSPIDGIIDSYERTWFVASLTSGKEYEIVLEGGSNPPSKLQFAVVYGVYDANGVTLPDSSDGRHGYGDARVTVRPNATGDYYIQVGDGTQLGVWVNGGPRGAFRFRIDEVGN